MDHFFFRFHRVKTFLSENENWIELPTEYSNFCQNVDFFLLHSNIWTFSFMKLVECAISHVEKNDFHLFSCIENWKLCMNMLEHFFFTLNIPAFRWSSQWLIGRTLKCFKFGSIKSYFNLTKNIVGGKWALQFGSFVGIPKPVIRVMIIIWMLSNIKFNWTKMSKRSPVT